MFKPHLACTLILISTLFSPSKALASTLRFAAFGDFGTGNSQQKKVAQALEKVCKTKGCDFILTLGDNIYNNGVSDSQDPQFLNKFEIPYARIDQRFYMVLGNHDYRGNVQAQIDYTQLSSKWYLPSHYYHFEKGPALFLALDTNAHFEKQNAYFNTLLQKNQRPWVLAFGHHPRKSNGYYKGHTTQAQKQLIDSLCSQAQLYLSGHEHNKQHIQGQCGTDYLIVGTGAGVRKGDSAQDSLYYAPTYGFSWFEITPQRLSFTLYNSDAEVEYNYTYYQRRQSHQP